ncbi:MAG: 30S ribosomal protein S20 [Clostridia bacterium]|nr:30S ribosomal protein S20 [Clostridia bacterium]
MPNIESAKKRVMVTAKQNANNVQKKSALRKQMKATYAAIEAKSADAKEKVDACLKAIDTAKSHGLYHENKANRDKSRLTKALNKA